MSQSIEDLEPLELNPWRVLVIAAHPGDIEFGASAAAAKWTKEGAEVIYLVATRGELSIPGIEPDEAALIRSGEQSAAAAAVGVRVVDFLDVDDGTVEPTVRLRRDIVRDIRHFGPDVVVVMNHREHEPDGTRNDPDHRAVGTAALDAIGAAANQWAFRDIGKAHTVDVVLVAGSPDPTHAIDVSGFEEDAVRAFSAHEQHLAAVADHPMADPTWVTSKLKTGSERVPGTSAAIPVERIDYAGGRPCHSTIVKEFEESGGRARVMRMPEKAELSKTPARARNAAPSAPKTRKASRKSEPKQPKTAPAPAGAMKLKVQLEQSGRSIGIEVPDNVMERLGNGGTRPNVLVEINETKFETTIGTNNGRRFIAINAERRKAAGTDIGDSFFVALSTPAGTTAAEAPAPVEVEAPAEDSGKTVTKRPRNRRPAGSRSKRR